MPEDVSSYFGFVYLIEQKNPPPNIPYRYVGCKQFNKKIRRPPLKGKKRKRIHVSSSDWETYYGSSEELKKAVEKYGEDSFSRTVLHLTTCKWETKFLEMVEQVKRNVLLDFTYYNGIVNLRIGKIPKSLKEKYSQFSIKAD